MTKVVTLNDLRKADVFSPADDDDTKLNLSITIKNENVQILRCVKLALSEYVNEIDPKQPLFIASNGVEVRWCQNTPFHNELSFPDALNLMYCGKKLSRTGWPPATYIQIEDIDKVEISKTNSNLYEGQSAHKWNPDQDDILSNDWFIVTEDHEASWSKARDIDVFGRKPPCGAAYATIINKTDFYFWEDLHSKKMWHERDNKFVDSDFTLDHYLKHFSAVLVWSLSDGFSPYPHDLD